MARAAILMREVRMEARNGRFRFFDWNIVNTSIGGCWEPVYIKGNNSGGTVDFDDAINRIDKVGTGVDFRNPFHRDPKSNRALTGGIMFLGRSLAFNNN